MFGGKGFRSLWKGGRPVLPRAGEPPVVRRHVASVEVGPGAVRRAREAVAGSFAEAGVVPGSAFADAVLLATGELVANVVRHAPRSPVTDVGIAVAAGQLIVSVEDAEPRLPDLSAEGMGAGLRMVAELAAEYGGGVGAERAVRHDGKAVLVRFRIPAVDLL